MLDFEWDPAKAESNLKKHGVPFPYATRVFLDPSRFNREDTRKNYGEERWITVGVIDGRVFVVVYALRRFVARPPVIRLISARKANDRETKQYHAFSA